MTEAEPSLDPHARRRTAAMAVGLLAAAVVVPWWALTWAGVAQFVTGSAAAAPFGLNQILVVHLLVGLAISGWLSWQMQRACTPGQHAVLIAVLLGLAVSAASGWVAPAVAESVRPWPAAGQHVARLVWVLLLQLPWCWAAMGLLRQISWLPIPHWRDAVTIGLLALVPTVYTRSVIVRQAQLVNDSLVNRQYWEAFRLLRPLAAVGPATVANQPADLLVQDLRQQVAALVQAVVTPLPDSPTIEQRLQRAEQLYQLADFGGTAQVLGDLPQSDWRASYRIGLSNEVQGRWQPAADSYQHSIQLLEQASVPLDADSRTVLRSAYERWANNLRRLGRYPEAERALQEGLRRWTTERPFLLMQLALHYEMAGRPAEAVRFYEHATAIDPRLQTDAQARLAQMRRQPEGCLLRRTPGATR